MNKYVLIAGIIAITTHVKWREQKKVAPWTAFCLC